MSFKCGCVLFLLACTFSFSYAQTRSSFIKGTVRLEGTLPAEAASVILLNGSDSSIIQSARADNAGAYLFRNIPSGAYILMATRVGYKNAYTPVSLSSEKEVTAPALTLALLNKDLAGVTITSRKPYVEVRPDKTIINPAAIITADGKNALDILAQSPGVRVDNNDNISISGRQNALILIDGKTTNMTGTDLAALLRSTQGSTIERFELLKAGSARYDAAAGGIINIVLKKGKNAGTNGSFNITGGYGKYYKSGGGLTFNHRSKSVNLFGSYSFVGNKTGKTFTNDRNINYAGVNSSYNLTYNSLQEFTTHNYRLGIDVALGANHTIGGLVYGFFNNNDFVKDNSLRIANRGQLDSSILVASTLDRDLRSMNYNLNYSGKLDKAGRTIAASITYSPYKRHSDEYINNRFLNAAGSEYRSQNFLQNLSPSDRYNYTALADYVNPLGKDARLEAGIKYSRTRSTNNLIFGPLKDGVYTVNPAFSNRFIYTENVLAGYLNYVATFGKVDITAGLRGEHTVSEGNSAGTTFLPPQITRRDYFNLFPNVLLHYTKNDKNEYSLAFNRGILRPDYESLNPFLYYIDPYNFQTGNPNLKPEYSNTLTLSHTYNQSITTSLYAGLTTDANFTFYRQNDSTKVNFTTARNIGRVKSVGLRFNAPYTITKWWAGSVDVDAAYLRYTTYATVGNLDKGTGDVIISSSQNFTITKLIAAEVSGRYETANQYGIRRFSPNYFVNAGISTLLFAKKGKLSFTLSDVFNTNRDRAYTNFQNLDLRIYDKRETHIARVSFSYRFGKTTVKAAKSHTTGNEDEQDRMKKVVN